MHAIGIDPGTATGWALLGKHGQRLMSGVWDISQKDGPRAHRWARLATALGALIDSSRELEPLEHVVIGVEHAYPATSITQELAGGHLAIIEFVAFSKGVDVRLFEYSSIKKFATGTGRASKLDMVIAANARFGTALPYNAKLGEVARDRAGKTKLDANGVPIPAEPTFPGGSDNHADALWIAALRHSQA